jgi:hypothetical protein
MQILGYLYFFNYLCNRFVLIKSAFKYTGIWFLLLLVLGQAIKPDLIEQLQKVPLLVKHYQHHLVDEGENIGFLAFIKMHYNEQSQHTNEEDHQQLPFFNHCSNYCIVLLHYLFEWPLFIPSVTAISQNDYFCNFYHFVSLSGIFQPPRS